MSKPNVERLCSARNSFNRELNIISTVNAFCLSVMNASSHTDNRALTFIICTV